ncbi:hypothetical protein CASFOL_042399 [Castilleja foliolosa]|uniref:BHLH domain-containing protein n=1 Tax=Castilleja foliolosa TaxID=1961234 RepID=A0ABD3BAC0_9LAMI
MEQLGAISEGEWNSMNEMCSDEAEFMSQLLGNSSFPNELPSDLNFQELLPIHGLNDDIALADHVYFPFSSSGDENGYYYNNPSAYHQVFAYNDNLMKMDLCMMENKEGDNFLNQDVISNDITESNEYLQLKTEPELPMADKDSGFTQCKKRACTVPRQERSNKRSMKLKKCMSVNDINDEDNNNKNTGLNRQSISEDDTNGKKRACRGSATDSQSLYARKRREKINERLKVLQKLVPNGTKVDISTML